MAKPIVTYAFLVVLLTTAALTPFLLYVMGMVNSGWQVGPRGGSGDLHSSNSADFPWRERLDGAPMAWDGHEEGRRAHLAHARLPQGCFAVLSPPSLQLRAPAVAPRCAAGVDGGLH